MKQAASETWQRISNFFSGNGFNTNEQVSTKKNKNYKTASVPHFATGTNYVPNDGLAYLHQGEAVVPKKYNTPYQPGMSDEEKLYMKQMISVMNALDGTIKEGITVNGQFTQKGSDLVAVVNKTRSQSGADLISNVAYAR